MFYRFEMQTNKTTLYRMTENINELGTYMFTQTPKNIYYTFIRLKNTNF